MIFSLTTNVTFEEEKKTSFIKIITTIYDIDVFHNLNK
jgi:hypothetical protein